MSNVFVIDTKKTPLNPVHPGRARMLLKQGKAAVFRRYPFTIILKKEVTNPVVEPLRIKLDPGSKTTGIAVVNDATGDVEFAAELTHRGQQIKNDLESRRAIRRGRRNRHTWYRRPPKHEWFRKRSQKGKKAKMPVPKHKREGWLAPSLKHRVLTTKTWVERIRKYCPIAAISVELVKFDTQLMQNPEISGVLYQQGELAGYEVRQYLLEKWGRKCSYCDKTDIPLEIEHIVPRSKGGSDRVSNLTLACTKCNQRKGNKPIEQFLKKKPELLKRVKSQAKAPLKDAAAVNSTRWALFRAFKDTGLPIETGTGGTTKFNRSRQQLPKTHWLDAGCVGKSTPEKLNIAGVKPLLIKATGHGKRQTIHVTKHGFPKRNKKGELVRKSAEVKVVKGFQTGDIVRAVVPSGKKAGIYVGRVAVRSSGSFNLSTASGLVEGVNHKYCSHIHGRDGYQYFFK